tara:strand:+ start:1595 stop:2020 length:426 start_codon:yes stop_codon:yes gene_type:complete
MFKNLLNFKKLTNPKKPLDFVKLALVCLGIYLVVKYLYKNLIKREGFQLNKDEKALCFLHMNGCGHCKDFMPEWNKAVKNNTSNIKMVDYEISTKDGRDLADKHNVSGFPSVLLLDSNKNKIKEYDGERTEAGLLDFLNKN